MSNLLNLYCYRKPHPTILKTTYDTFRFWKSISSGLCLWIRAHKASPFFQLVKAKEIVDFWSCMPWIRCEWRTDKSYHAHSSSKKTC